MMGTLAVSLILASMGSVRLAKWVSIVPMGMCAQRTPVRMVPASLLREQGLAKTGIPVLPTTVARRGTVSRVDRRI